MFDLLREGEETDLPYVMSNQDGTVAADNLVQITAWLLRDPEYIKATHEQAQQKRDEYCCFLAEFLQEGLAEHMQKTCYWDYREEYPSAVEVLVVPDRTEPLEIESWHHPVPLVLVTTLYAPYSDVPPVQGDVVWLDPRDERFMLESLSDAGVVDFRVQCQLPKPPSRLEQSRADWRARWLTDDAGRGDA